jgi:hypothetical protein
MSTPEPADPAANLINLNLNLNLILALLAPMFLWSTCGDLRLAHIAAAETLREYRGTNRLSLWTVAKIIAFDIARRVKSTRDRLSPAATHAPSGSATPPAGG